MSELRSVGKILTNQSFFYLQLTSLAVTGMLHYYKECGHYVKSYVESVPLFWVEKQNNTKDGMSFKRKELRTFISEKNNDVFFWRYKLVLQILKSSYTSSKMFHKSYKSIQSNYMFFYVELLVGFHYIDLVCNKIKSL